ncbi:trans-resveratrol di-O-methyltransferase-like [Rutidosis leptorrhynchoides]|uniref:trans-resveratrol di-O-methyltransferase-like n=1 Tax=Rutidosis leptorrhynchoides TaxID=125765 RepID=UPI003A998071
MKSTNYQVNDDELLEAHTHIWKHTFNFITSMSLKCAIELGIPDIIYKHGQPMTLPKLLSILPINPKKSDSVYRLMRNLVHSGFFTQQQVPNLTGDSTREDGYVLTSASYLLLKDNPFHVSPFSLMILDTNLMAPWQSKSTWLQNDDPTPYYTAHSKSLWELAGDEPRVNKVFNDAMASDSHFVGAMMIKKSRSVFEGLKSLVDVGGGTGTLANVIAQEFPNIECIVLDLPHVLVDSKDFNNLKYVSGDMFNEIPSANAVLLKWILHDWNDEECVRILKRCKEAVSSYHGNGGKVIVIDMVMGNKNGLEAIAGSSHDDQVQLLFDMVMMTLTKGKERNEKEWSSLFSCAGFSHYKIYPILGARSVIEVYP